MGFHLLTMSDNPTTGLEAWEARRKAWTTPNEHYLAHAKEFKEKAEQRKIHVTQEGQRIAIYKQLVIQRGTFRTALSLQHVVKYIFIK